MNTYSAKVEERVSGARTVMIKEQTEIFRQFLSDDRADGAQKAFYEVNIANGFIQVLGRTWRRGACKQAFYEVNIANGFIQALGRPWRRGAIRKLGI